MSTKKDEGKRIPVIHSMRFKVMAITIVGVIISYLLCAWTAIPVANKDLTELAGDALSSLASAYKMNVQKTYDIASDNGATLSYDDYAGILEDGGVDNVESSYVYLVSEDGTMLYHPTKEKVGEPVENVVVKGLVEQMSKGIVPDDGVTSYDFNGTVKYAGYAILDNHDIVVVSADESDILSGNKTLFMRIVFGAVFVLVILAIVSFFLASAMIKPLKALTIIIYETAQFNFCNFKDGDRLLKRRDECGLMARAVFNMRESLTGVIRQIGQVSQGLENTVRVLEDTSKDINLSCTDNSATTEELAAGMQETNAMTENISSNIGNVKKESNEINGMSKNGMTLSGEIEGRAGQLKVNTEKAVERTKEMFTNVKADTEKAIEESKAVEQINMLTEAIMGISAQTSLLALNASIEAARAGKAGRGFAVVATEIGDLAKQTQDTVASINEIVASINGTVLHMVDMLNNSIGFLENTVLPDYQNFYSVSLQYASDADTFNNSMSEIQNSIGNLDDTIASMAEALEGINNTVSESANGVMTIAEQTSNVVDRTTTNAQLVEDCKNDALELKKITEMFHIE